MKPAKLREYFSALTCVLFLTPSIFISGCLSEDKTAAYCENGQKASRQETANIFLIDNDASIEADNAAIIFWDEVFPKCKDEALKFASDIPEESPCVIIADANGIQSYIAYYHDGEWKWLGKEAPYLIEGGLNKEIDSESYAYIAGDLKIKSTLSDDKWDLNFKAGLQPENSYICRAQCGISDGGAYKIRFYAYIFSPHNHGKWIADIESGTVFNGQGMAGSVAFSTNNPYWTKMSYHSYRPFDNILLNYDEIYKDILAEAREIMKKMPKESAFIAFIEGEDENANIEIIVPLADKIEHVISADGRYEMNATANRTKKKNVEFIELDIKIIDIEETEKVRNLGLGADEVKSSTKTMLSLNGNASKNIQISGSYIRGMSDKGQKPLRHNAIYILVADDIE